MFAVVIAIHVIACILLIGIILVQAGRGGGLVESLSQVESMFGTKTNAFLTKATSVLSVVFFMTCIGLAAFSLRQSRSLMSGVKTAAPVSVTVTPGNETVKAPAVAQPQNSTTASLPAPAKADDSGKK